jgi:hypothetical protein
MSHGSNSLQIMNLYGSLLMEKFRIGKVSQFGQKVIVIIVWGPTGFAVVAALDSQCKFNTGYSVSKVPTSLSERWRERRARDFRKLIAHACRVLSYLVLTTL